MTSRSQSRHGAVRCSSNIRERAGQCRRPYLSQTQPPRAHRSASGPKRRGLTHLRRRRRRVGIGRWRCATLGATRRGTVIGRERWGSGSLGLEGGALFVSMIVDPLLPPRPPLYPTPALHSPTALVDDLHRSSASGASAVVTPRAPGRRRRPVAEDS
jgi:hypothetical protein